GSEATYQLIKRGIKVNLYEMRPKKNTVAHQTAFFSELICSNSLRALSIENAVGLLKEEMMMFDSLIMKAAHLAKVEAGGALAVDRIIFASFITDYLKNHPLVNLIAEEVIDIPLGPTIIATGPLTSENFSSKIKEFCGDEDLYFFDAIAPIILEESINKDIAYLKSRYDKGEASYYNCPMSEEEFEIFYNALITAEVVQPKDFELKVFEGCMPVEEMARRGKQTLLFGPMKPVGLINPKTGKMPYAVVQLRQDDAAKSMYNIVGFQTHLKFGEQKRVFSLIPGLENLEIVRYGVMHKNTFINSPNVLNKYYQSLKRNDLFFAGQITGVEGYLESAASGLVASINMALYLNNFDLIDFTNTTSMGALANYISTLNKNFQPMNVNFGIFDELKIRNKKDKKKEYASRSLNKIKEIKEVLDERFNK
ncbi:MAG: methylenetetrahydrofolate--tRNA-(uracil(54)-C(5))-methyltransferase (FADH(2)-oxidizing) TrmFO, partial [Bacilli bacterium]|nr:methylenetetrahydrofolate--tRNA-(uracil(54)-C(5))-methyltransferase (FADH(2)-oxidizing) TrmFO [Bacilli bacterium]